MQLHHDFPNWGILLPYKAYLDRIEKYPEEEEKLKEMRAIVDEDSICPNFKYVAEELDDDKCIYLLYKIRKSLKVISDEHGFVKIDREKVIIEQLIQKSWERRGLYPSLSRILDIIAEVEDDDQSIGDAIISKLKEKFGEDPNQLEVIFSLLTDKDQEIPAFLEDVSSEIETLQNNIADHLGEIDLLKKLSLFELTNYQLKRIINQTDEPFKKPIAMEEITQNPYLIAESYVAQEQDLDNPKILYDAINVFKIDIGMFPDKRYLKKTNGSIQNLTQKSPERLRAIIVDYLKEVGKSGDCYAPLDAVYNSIIKYPLFYKEELDLNKLDLTSQTNRYHEHFKDRLKIIENKGEYFFYLREVHHGEQSICGAVNTLLKRKDWNADTSWVGNYVEQEADVLAQKIPDFDRANFIQERTALYKRFA